MRTRFQMIIAAALLTATASSTMAVTVPFTEDFSADAANWFNANGAAVVDWVATGGPDGSAYVTTTFNFVSSTPADTPALFRAQEEFNSSGNAFVGDWVTAGVGYISGWVRHDTGVPTTFFIRYASPANFPGAASLVLPAVPSGQWTGFTIPIPDPNFVFEGPFTFPDVFGNIGHVQIGVAVPPSLAGVDQSFTFDLDRVGIGLAPPIPATSTMGMLAALVLIGCAGAVVVRRRTAALSTGGTATSLLFAVMLLHAGASVASATIVPFTEDFSANASNWYDSMGANPVSWNMAGGPDGGAYVSTAFNPSASAANDNVLLFRAQEELNSSGNAFAGNWIADGVDEFSFLVRHDATAPVNFFARFASPANFPAAVGVGFIPVLPNTWTPVTIALPNPALIYEGPFVFADVFDDIGHVQLGLSVPAALAGVDQSFTFDVDKVSIVPEPSAALLLGVAISAAAARRRRHAES